jgi:hypothetical protein
VTHGSDVVETQQLSIWIGVSVALLKLSNFLLVQVKIENNAMVLAQERSDRVVQQDPRSADRGWIYVVGYSSSVTKANVLVFSRDALRGLRLVFIRPSTYQLCIAGGIAKSLRPDRRVPFLQHAPSFGCAASLRVHR